MSATIGLPAGQVTFVMTDIEGSTDLLRRLGDAFAPLVFRHRELIQHAVNRHGGMLFGNEGDACFCAFPEASAALCAAIDAQRSLQQEPWPAEAQLRVRMGLHTGPAQPYGDNYIAMAVHQAARVAAAGHGGQILLTATTRAAAGQALPAELVIDDLGGFRLKDFADAEHLYQLSEPGLLAAFPSLRTLSARSHNLPRPVSSFIGRADQRAALGLLLRDQSLVTLAGPGGVGKTRLALEVAGDVLPHFPDGVWLVELAAARDLESTVRACAFALSVSEHPGRSLLDSVVASLEGKRLLLILDNCEQVIDAACVLAQRLMTASGIKLLATSREPLRLSREQLLRVTPLPTGDATSELSEAARLFVERVQGLRADFQLDPPTVAAVAEICRRLDGVPLALELAASRVRALPVSEVAKRLKDRFRLLSGGSRDGVARHQTLRAVVEWSYELLTPVEQLLFQRLSAFADGWSLETAEQVCGGDDINPEDTLDLLTALVDKSLVTYSDSAGEYRYGMLETLHDFASEKLRDGDGDATQIRLLDWALQLAETAAPLYTGADGPQWMNRLVAEQDNLRAALETGYRHGANNQTLRLTAALTHFWIKRGRLREGAQWSERAAALVVDDRDTRAQLLIGFGRLLRGTDNRRAESLLREALETGRASANPQVQLEALKQLTTSARDRGDYDAAEQVLSEQLRLLHDLNDDYRQFIVATELATLSLQRGDCAAAAVGLRRQLQQAEQHHWRYDGARLSNSLAIALIELGDYVEAYRLTVEAIGVLRELRNLEIIGHLQSTAGVALLHQQDFEAARVHFTESGRIALELGASNLAPEVLERLAAVELACGRALVAARYAAAADALYDAVGYQREPADRRLRDDLQAGLVTAMKPELLMQAQQQGGAQPRRVLAEALGAAPIAAFDPQPAITPVSGSCAVKL